jgi:polyferredoxin
MSCPIGIFQAFSSIRQIPFFLIGFLGGVGILFGRAACGWLCPFGWIQDQCYKIPGKKFHIPKILNYGKYATLVILVILLPFFFEAHWFSRICPWGTLAAGIPWMLWNPIDPSFGEPVIEPGMIGWLFTMKISILVAFLVLFVVSKRPFCRTTCPLGALYSFFNRVSAMRMQVTGKCVDCDLCLNVCPVDIRIADDPNSPDCIRCLKCTVCKNVSVQWKIGYDTGTTEHTPVTTEG